MTKDEIRINLAGPCGYSYDLRDELTDLFGDLYARVLASEARIAALESPAPSDPVTDASAAAKGWQALFSSQLNKEGAYLAGFADGAKYGRGRK
jgi:hypothetical protein